MGAADDRPPAIRQPFTVPMILRYLVFLPDAFRERKNLARGAIQTAEAVAEAVEAATSKSVLPIHSA